MSRAAHTQSPCRHRALLARLRSTLVVLAVASAAPLLAQPPSDTAFTLRPLTTVNSSADDYAPYLHPDGVRLFLTSSRSGSAKLYVSTVDATGWSVPAYVQLRGVNSAVDDGSFAGPFPTIAQIYPLDDRLAREAGVPSVALMTSGRRRDGEGDADIYLLRLGTDGALVEDPIPLTEINSDRWDSQPTISPDGSFIIFTSVRSDEGGMDLYISRRQPDGAYGAPQSLGPTINTADNEVSPHISPDGRTLFFSSNGHAGYGGADIFRTRMRDDGTWELPTNLGPKINSPANEIFFFGAGRERCLLASDRSGGMGGLDIYEATPNIFAPGYETVTWTLHDETTGRGVGGRMRIVEISRGRTVHESTIDPERGVDVPLLAGFGYRVELSPTGFADTTFTVDGLTADKSTRRRISFASTPPPVPVVPTRREFQLEGLSVPLFVSGYYRLNMPELLEDLRVRQAEGDLTAETYITNVATNRKAYDEYRTMAVRVGRIVDEFVARAITEDFPAFNEGRLENEWLEITVLGYADPRPIIGTYDEKSVTFFDTRGAEHTVNPGDSLDNLKLAGLRAHYAKEYIDARFRAAAAAGHREYLDLVDRGLIRWRIVSGDVDDITRGDSLAEKRRIRVEFRRAR
jgi:hypothetical protein